MLRAFTLTLVLFAALVAPSFAEGPGSTPLWLTVPQPPSLPPPDRSGFVTRDGAGLYYAVYNPRAGHPVLLLHGGLTSADSWGYEVPILARNHTVVVMDTRGHGRSTWDGKTLLTYGAMMDDAMAVIHATGLKSPRLWG